MPQMGISVAEGTIVEWRKQPGDRVEADETDRRRHHRQDRRRDPVAGEPARSRGSWSSRARRVDVGTAIAEIGRRRRRAHGEADTAPPEVVRSPVTRSGRPRVSPTARASTRRWCGGSPTSTASTSRRSRAAGSAAACASATSLAHRSSTANANADGRKRERRPPHRVALQPGPAARVGAGSRATNNQRWTTDVERRVTASR